MNLKSIRRSCFVGVVLAAAVFATGCGSQTEEANALIATANANLTSVATCTAEIGKVFDRSAMDAAAVGGLGAQVQTCLKSTRAAHEALVQAKGLKLAEEDHEYVSLSGQALEAALAGFSQMDKDYVPALVDLVELEKLSTSIKEFDVALGPVFKDIETNNFDKARKSLEDYKASIQPALTKAKALTQKMPEAKPYVDGFQSTDDLLKLFEDLIAAVQAKDQAKADQVAKQIEEMGTKMDNAWEAAFKLDFGNFKLVSDLVAHFDRLDEFANKAMALGDKISVDPVQLDQL